jgi:hypothetical protein
MQLRSTWGTRSHQSILVGGARDVNWVDEDAAGEGQTALCAKCGIDSVVGDESGFPITRDFMAEMHQHWF